MPDTLHIWSHLIHSTVLWGIYHSIITLILQVRKQGPRDKYIIQDPTTSKWLNCGSFQVFPMLKLTLVIIMLSSHHQIPEKGDLEMV